MTLQDLIQNFLREDVRGILVSNEDGELIYSDERFNFTDVAWERWKLLCPPPSDLQRGEEWEFVNKDAGKYYHVLTSTAESDGQVVQLHYVTDVSDFLELYNNLTQYSGMLKEEKEHDQMTGLFNKGKFMDLKRTLFPKLSSIAIFNMDVNNLKYMNDTFGHEAGDRLLIKAARSLQTVSARNVMGFRLGGDEFMLVALHVSLEDAEKIKANWEEALRKLNEEQDGIECVIACGMAYGTEGYNLDELLAQADQLMYEDKVQKKGGKAPR